MLYGQFYGDREETPVGRGGGNAAPMGLHNGLGDGQPQTVAAGLGVAGGIGAVKPVEQKGSLLFGDGSAGIAHREHQIIFLPFQAAPGPCAGQSILEGVVQQDGQQLVHRLGVPAMDNSGWMVPSRVLPWARATP